MAGSWLIASVCMRADDGDVVHHLRGVRQQFGNPGAGLAVLRELEDRRRDRESGSGPLSWWSGAGPCEWTPAGPCRTSPSSPACSRKLHLRRRADHVQVDARFAFGGKCGRPGSPPIASAARPPAAEDCQRERSDPLRSAREEVAASFLNRHFARIGSSAWPPGGAAMRYAIKPHCLAAVVAVVIRQQNRTRTDHLFSHVLSIHFLTCGAGNLACSRHSGGLASDPCAPPHLFNTSSRFSNWLASIVRAASSLRASEGSGLRSPSSRNSRASSGCVL